MEHEIISNATEHMKKSIDLLMRELAKIRAGRPSPSLFDSITVDYYGTITPLAQVASINIPNPKQVIIQPWDKSILNEIEKSLQASDLSFNPSNDGNLIRVPIPPLSSERRTEYVKLVHTLCEKTKVSIRNIRRDANDSCKKLLKKGDISEDTEKAILREVQKCTDSSIENIDLQQTKKEQEIMDR